MGGDVSCTCASCIDGFYSDCLVPNKPTRLQSLQAKCKELYEENEEYRKTNELQALQWVEVKKENLILRRAIKWLENNIQDYDIEKIGDHWHVFKKPSVVPDEKDEYYFHRSTSLIETIDAARKHYDG